jgi:hypothetical protein
MEKKPIPQTKVMLIVCLKFIEGHVCYLADDEHVTDNIFKAKHFPLDTTEFGLKGVKFETARVNA